MSVTLRGVTLYSASEVSAMTPTGTIDSQWETYDLPGINGWNSTAYSLGKFHVNKITGLVTGEIGIRNNSSVTSVTYGSNTNLGIHNAMQIKYPGSFEYAITKSATTAAVNNNVREINTTITTTGNFSLQGRSWAITTVNQYLENYLETFAYIGSKYGKIYTQERNPIYLKEGAFYHPETVDLITGHAWLKQTITLPTGYGSNSLVTVYKNLWSGECILQYSLCPTTAGTMPSITLPARFSTYTNQRFYTDIRYCNPATTYANRHNCWMNLAGNYLTFNPITGLTWATGSLYYQGNPETNAQGNGSETVVGLWLPETNQAIPSVNNAKFPRNKSGLLDKTDLDSYWGSPKYNHPRSSDPSWATLNHRTGMLNFYMDMNTAAAGALTSPVNGSDWSPHWIPSYRYNKTSGTSIPLYCAGAQYISSSIESLTSGWSCNLACPTGTSLGVGPTVRKWSWGTSGEMNPSVANLACFNGYFLSNYNGNITQ